jgi:tetratricopeptide (TPR) repeat protein
LLPQAQQLYTELGEGSDAVKALAANVLAYTLYQSGHAEEALATARQSATVADKCGDYGELAFALGVQGSALQELGRPQDAIEVLRLALPIAEQHDPRRVAPASANLAVVLASIGRYRDAAERARQAVQAAERSAERLFERYARLSLGRALCSLGEWERSIAEIESVRGDVPPFYAGMAIAPLVVIALARGEEDRLRALVAEYEQRSSRGDARAFESDFRMLRAAVLAGLSRNETEGIARLIPQAGASDYAEWTGWLAPIVDRLVTQPEIDSLDAALTALREPGAMKRTPPVRAQAARLEAHLAARTGQDALAADRFQEAERLTDECGMVFESAAIVLERAEHATSRGEPPAAAALAGARATFAELGAAPWLARAERISLDLQRAR